MKRFESGGIECEVCSSGTGGPIIYTCVFPEQNCDEVFDAAVKRCGADPFSMVCFRPRDWRRDCAPWTAEVDGETWIGEAENLLNRLAGTVLPETREILPDSGSAMIAGYSMAGLFALWAMYKTDVFRGCASCSGSLWYPGWDTFADENYIQSEDAGIYLSVGGKESKGAPAYMACIDTRIREQIARMKKDPRVRYSLLEMNPGGHFANPNDRLAKGIARLLGYEKHLTGK